ncbi:hypothetical protein Btru_012752 [Bulinus truncatus]|nr:hypothetical protein Btru_012752 [Bulinus truncatus]
MDSYDNLIKDLKNANYQQAMEALDSIERNLKEVDERLMNLRVRSCFLEVELAAQFGPDLMLFIEKMEESCESCTRTVTDTLFSNDEEQHCEGEQRCDDDSHNDVHSSMTVSESLAIDLPSESIKENEVI